MRSKEALIISVQPMSTANRPWQGCKPVRSHVTVLEDGDSAKLEISTRFVVRNNGKAPAWAKLFLNGVVFGRQACAPFPRLEAGDPKKPNTLTLQHIVHVTYQPKGAT